MTGWIGNRQSSRVLLCAESLKIVHIINPRRNERTGGVIPKKGKVPDNVYSTAFLNISANIVSKTSRLLTKRTILLTMIHL